MESTICFKQLAFELENIRYLQEKKKRDICDIIVISDSFSNITINSKKKKNKKTNSQINNLLLPTSNGIKKKKLFKDISKYEIDLIIKPKKKRMIPFEKFERNSIIEIVLKLPKLIEESCYNSLLKTRELLPSNLNSLYKQNHTKLKKDNYQMYMNFKNHLLISIFIDTCRYLDNLKGIHKNKGYKYQINGDVNELFLIFNKKKVKQFNENIKFMFFEINDDIIIDNENETYYDLDDYTRDGIQLLKLITPRIVKIINKNNKIEEMKFKDRLDLITMIFNFCCVIQYLLYRF